MKLLFDQNLSFKLCPRLNDLFPDSSQVRLLGLAQVDDAVIWNMPKRMVLSSSARIRTSRIGRACTIHRRR
jgi:predicted nuclease of predicted toxin-antitoxin system